VPNPVKCFAVRLLHASLPCNALRASLCTTRPPPSASACPCCKQPGVRETYTHLFLECPCFAGAVGWLLDLWAHLSGGARPPATAALVVADAPGAWPAAQRPEGQRAVLWQALRLTLLFNVWAARCSGEPARMHARAVVAATVAALREQIQLQYRRAHCRPALDPWLPARALGMRRAAAPAASLDVWLHPSLVVVGGPGAQQQAQQQQAQQQAQQQQPQQPFAGGGLPPLQGLPRGLRIVLDMQQPVPAPPAPAGAP
jgi:hypothetical protein